MKSQAEETQAPATGDNDISTIAQSLFKKVKSIKDANPGPSRKIDQYEKEIREKISKIKSQIAKLDKKSQDLVTILVINGIHKAAEEELID